MTRGVLEPFMQSYMPKDWKIHTFKGNAGIVLDTKPDSPDAFSVMVIGHADKIRMQVRSIGDDGKIWVNLELQIHGKDKKGQVEALGIRPGDPIIYDRPIERGFSPNTFMGAYLDNGLGCFVTAEIGRLIAESTTLSNIRYLGAMASHEEIGRFGSRVLAEHFRPDVTIAVDVAHDFTAAPGIGDRRYEPLAMGEGYTLTHGAVTSAALNSMLTKVSLEQGIPVQHELAGRDTGTDAMAAVLASIDSASASIGFPIRNMHTISETGHTHDLETAIHAIHQTMVHMDGLNGGKGISGDDLRESHPRLDESETLEHRPAAEESKD